MEDFSQPFHLYKFITGGLAPGGNVTQNARVSGKCLDDLTHLDLFNCLAHLGDGYGANHPFKSMVAVIFVSSVIPYSLQILDK